MICRDAAGAARAAYHSAHVHAVIHRNTRGSNLQLHSDVDHASVHVHGSCLGRVRVQVKGVNVQGIAGRVWGLHVPCVRTV